VLSIRAQRKPVNVMHHYKMTRTIIIIILTSFIFISCGNPKVTPSKNDKEVVQQSLDTTKAVKIDKYWVEPKESFEYNSLGNFTNDTLKLITCSEYVFSPFGSLREKAELKTSMLKNFSVISRVDTMKNGEFEFNVLNLKTSKLILFFNDDPEASRSSYVFKGEINDSDVKFRDNIRIGMSKEDFIRTFFKTFPNELLQRYKVIVLESCVTDIWHTYTFIGNKLKAVSFKTDSWWAVDYEKFKK